MLKDFFTQSELTELKSICDKHITHPVKDIVFNSTNRYVNNTNSAYQNVSRVNKRWLDNNKKRFFEKKDFTESASVLGEMRAYSDLLKTSFSITPINVMNTPTPDFKGSYRDLNINVEVNSKQMNDRERLDLISSLQKGKSIKSFVPFGKAKNLTETITLNAISKLSNIKHTEAQFDSCEQNILWVDLQDNLWSKILTQEMFCSIRVFNNYYTSGEFWHAFYGKMNTLIHENSTYLLECPILVKVRMSFIGRFLRNSKINAVIFSLEDFKIFYDNPNRPLDVSIRDELFNRLNISKQFSEYKKHLYSFKKQLKQERRKIFNLRKKLKYKMC